MWKDDNKSSSYDTKEIKTVFC